MSNDNIKDAVIMLYNIVRSQQDYINRLWVAVDALVLDSSQRKKIENSMLELHRQASETAQHPDEKIRQLDRIIAEIEKG